MNAAGISIFYGAAEADTCIAPEGEDEPTKYWLSTLPKNIPFRDFVDATKLRWRIERGLQAQGYRGG
jgi:SRSO17 transposase